MRSNSRDPISRKRESLLCCGRFEKQRYGLSSDLRLREWQSRMAVIIIYRFCGGNAAPMGFLDIGNLILNIIGKIYII